MPYYEVRHSYPLTSSQKQTFATKLTNLHAETFTAPSLFVNIQFSHINSTTSDDPDFFIAGKPKSSANRVLGQLRGGGTRGQEAFDKLAEDIQTIWNEIVGYDGKSKEKELHGVFIMPGLIARERGFAIPPVGKEGNWLETNMEKFKEKAEAGDEDFKDLFDEVKKRPELLQNKN